ncbi:DNA mismatch repair endonuclease MutL [bacterium]|nr:DNA mismatch repair endonuclease MutL [bacterium]
MGRIVQLSKNVINQIAAGEVIERPYSVIKELVENSIDAGATKISVEIANECRDMRVADNGSGIHPDDILLAFSKHATSKILNGEDLYNISTMGFRGEALASIISISKLTCITRTKDFDYGIKVECQNSEVKQVRTGCAIGTVMEIKDLFYNIPARLKFLKSPKTELSYVTEYLQSISLVNPNISFELKFNGKTVFKTTAQNEQIQTIKEIFSNEISAKLKPVLMEDKLSGLKISGYVSSPDYTRSSKKDYYTYVNSRLVKCPAFQKSIDNVYRNLIGNNRYPFIILNLEIPPIDVDVNVHPTKKEVRYKNPNQIFNFIYTSINSALTSYKSQETINKSSINLKEENKENNNKDENKILSPDYNENDDIYVSANSSIADIFAKKQLEEKNHDDFVKATSIKSFDQNANDKKPIQIPVQSKLIEESDFTEKDIIIGQYKKTYILIEKENGLEIVDQHIADERYIYEKLKRSKNIDCQLLFISDVLEVSPVDKELLELNKEKLSKFGYEIEILSDTEIIFRKVPQLLSKVSPKEILSDILENLSGTIDNIEEKILITTSCKAAVKANTYLNHYQMEEIIKNWRETKNPETCPHGRPISKFIEHKDLAKFFLRNV